MTIAKCASVATEQPRLRIEHRVLMAPAGGNNSGHPGKLENLLDAFYREHGPAWELVNVFKVGTSDFMASQQELMFIFQRRTYQSAPD